MRTVFVIWKNPQTSMWHPVAKLRRDSNHKYFFNYTIGAQNKDFSAFPRMTDLSETYVSNELFSFFKNRLVSPSRPEFSRLLEWSNMTADTYDELDILGIYGGERKTDGYRVVAAPEPDDTNIYRILFFISGVSHLPKESLDFLSKLITGQSLRFKLEDNNIFDENAVLIISDSSKPVTLGYCPRYYNCDVRKLLSTSEAPEYSLKVVKHNIEAPPQYRLLCEFSAHWPDGFSALVSNEYQNFTKKTEF